MGPVEQKSMVCAKRKLAKHGLVTRLYTNLMLPFPLVHPYVYPLFFFQGGVARSIG